MFVGGIGQVAIWLALILNVLAAGAWLLDRSNPDRNRLAGWFFAAGVASFFVAFGCLVALFMTGQFQYAYVFKHSAVGYEWKYRLAGVWSGQEGSFLLWALGSSLFGLIVAPRTGIDRRWFTIVFALFLGSLAGILVYESPFALVPEQHGQLLRPENGRGMPPSLLNYWVTIHPPTIFLGFGCLTVLYAWAMAALARKDLTTWLDGVRPWAILSLTLLGLGLCMGGFWAYETLGWGGFWMWDPVENTSFVPWVVVASFVHGIFIQKAKGKWAFANVALGAAPFLLFVYGTFLTRSGFLQDTSVHSFAEMQRGALMILVGVGATAILAFLGLFFARFASRSKWFAPPEIPEGDRHGPLQKQTFYGTAVWMLSATGLITAIGMSTPLIQSMRGLKPALVEEHLYHQVLAWPFPVIMLAMAIAPFLTWRPGSLRALLGKLTNVLAVSIGLVGMLLLWLKSTNYGVPADLNATVHFFGGIEVSAAAWVLFLSWLCMFAIFANLLRMIQLWRTARPSIGGLITHVGVAVTMFGLIFSRGFEQKAFVLVHPTKNDTAFGYSFDLIGPTSSFTDRNNKIEMRVSNEKGSFIGRPGLYFVPGQDGEPMPTIWPHIQRWPLFDIYMTAGEFAWEATESVEFKPGDKKLFARTLLTFEGLRTEGNLGTIGAKFIADVKVEGESGESIVTPSITIAGEGQLENTDVAIDQELKLRLDRIDAASKSVFLTILYAQPAYPMEVMYKPLTWLVWIGVGIMTVGGFISARYRRVRSTTENARDRVDADTGAPNPDETESTSQV